MDYRNLSDYEINKRVAMLIGGFSEHDFFDAQSVIFRRHGKFQYSFFEPCTNPADAWPIIEENRISIRNRYEGDWKAETEWGESRFHVACNPLRAAMIVFLMKQESVNVSANSTGSDLR